MIANGNGLPPKDAGETRVVYLGGDQLHNYVGQRQRLARPSVHGSDTTTRNDLTRPTPMTERRWRSTLGEGQHNKPHGVHLNTAARLSKGWGPPHIKAAVVAALDSGSNNIDPLIMAPG